MPARTSLFLGLILWLTSTNASKLTSEYLAETSECARNSVQVKLCLLEFTLGSATFKSLIEENHVFVDKSLLLREIFKDHTFLTIFYLPPKFSKTINLDMIRTFVEIQLDSNYSIVAREHTYAYNYFALGNILYENGSVESQLLKPPLISGHMDLIDQHAAQHPVIYFNFGIVWGITYGTSWSCVKDRIGREFRRYSFLRSRISANESARYMQLFDYFNHTQWTTNNDPAAIDLPSTVIFLAEMTAKVFQRKPILFIDEYDSLLESVLHKGYINEQEDRQVLAFFHHFINTVFSREDLWNRIILTGTHSTHRNIMDSLPGSKAIYHALDNNLSHFFGFTDTDVGTISKHFQHLATDLVEKIRDHYKGYQMGQLYPIYCPWSIMNSLLSKKLTNHWAEKTKYKHFTYNLWGINELRELWLDLLSDRSEYVSYPFEKFTQDDFWSLRNTLGTSLRGQSSSEGGVSLNSKEFTQAVMYQVDIGYLTWSNYASEDHDTKFNLRIPNVEIRKAVYDAMRLSYKGYPDVNINLADDATATLHAYLFSHQRDEFFKVLARSFERLFNQTGGLFGKTTSFEKNQSFVQNTSLQENKNVEENTRPVPDQIVNPISDRLIDYIGLRLRYQHDHRLDRKIANGFISCKLNVCSVVIFNCNQSINNEDLLNQIDNMTHPWTQLDPESTNASVTYLVISVKNGTEICTRRYGAEPPIEATSAAPTTVQTTKKKKKGKVSGTTVVRRTLMTKRPKTGTKFNRKATKALNASLGNETMATQVDGMMKGHRSEITNDSLGNNFNVTNSSDKNSTDTTSTSSFQQSLPIVSIPHESLSASQFNSKVTGSLNESIAIETMVTRVGSVTKSIESQKQSSRFESKKHHPDNFTTTHSKENNSTDVTSFKTTQQSLFTKSILPGSKFNTFITKSLIDSFTNETTIPRVDNVTKIHTSDFEKHHSEENISTTVPTTNSTSIGPIEPITSTASTSHLSSSNCKFCATLTKSSNNSFPNQKHVTQVAINDSNGTAVQELPHSTKSTPVYIENNTFSTITFTESSLKQITRVTRSVPVEPSPSTILTTAESKSASKFNSDATKSLENEAKVTDCNTTTSVKSHPTEITTMSPVQQSTFILSTDKKSESGSKVDPNIIEASNNSLTNQTKVTKPNTSTPMKSNSTITTTVTLPNSSTTLKPTPEVTESLKNQTKITNSDTAKSLTKDPTEITTMSAVQQSTTILSTDKKSESGPKLDPDIIKASNNSLTNQTKVTKPDTSSSMKSNHTITTKIAVPNSSTASKPTPEVTESLKNQTKVTNSDTARSLISDPTSTSTVTPFEQSPPTVFTTEESKSTTEFQSKTTTSLKNETKITDFNTTTPAKSNPTTIITISPAQQTSSPKPFDKITKSGSKFNLKVTKALNESVTKETKVASDTSTFPKSDPTTINTLVSDQTSPSGVSTTSKSNLKVTKSLNESVTNETKAITPDTAAPFVHIKNKPSNITTITPSRKSPFSKSNTTKYSKSGSKFSPKFTKPFNASFTKKKKGKNFNVTAFVRGNSSKITKFTRGQQTSTSTDSTTTEITRDTFFPPPRPTKGPYTRRCRTGSKVIPNATTISRVKYLKLFFGIHG